MTQPDFSEPHAFVESADDILICECSARRRDKTVHPRDLLIPSVEAD